MPVKKKNEGLPIAVATQGGLLSALAVLMIGTFHGGRAWIILVKAGTAFLLSAAILKILTAGVMMLCLAADLVLLPVLLLRSGAISRSPKPT